MTNTFPPATHTATGQQPCPRCGTMLPIHSNYVTWCDQCNWNLAATLPPRPRTLFESFYVSLGAKLSDQLFTNIKNQASLSPRLTPAKILAFGLATLVHATTIVCAVLGIVILRTTFPYPIPTLFGVVCLMLAWTLRPQLGRLPAAIAAPAHFPTLYAVVNRIAQALGAPPVDALLIDESFNASYAKIGWRRQQLITIGLPLFAILTPQEQVAILAHEVAHGVNGDQNRTLFVGSAITTLIRWYQLLRPQRIWEDAGQHKSSRNPAGLLTYLAGAFSNVLLLGLSFIPWLWSYILSHLLWRNAQRAEYLADALAAHASGTAAMLSALEKLHYGGVVRQTVQSITLNPHERTLIPLLREQVAALPARELERIRRSETLGAARLDVTHPPTTYRTRLLQAHPVLQPQITLTDDEAALVEKELVQIQAQVQRDLVDTYRRRLYY
jgi:Zn-dependent protease with chaperone function